MVIGGELLCIALHIYSGPVASTEPPMVIGGELADGIASHLGFLQLQRSRRW